MAIQRFETRHIDIIHRAFHGDSAAPYCMELMDQFHNGVALWMPADEHGCIELAAVYATQLYLAKPYGQQTADTAMVTALVLLRLCGITIEAGDNHDLYDHLRTEPTPGAYMITLMDCVEDINWPYPENVTSRLDIFGVERELGNLDSPEMQYMLADEARAIAQNYLINPLYGAEPPKAWEPSADERYEQEEYEIQRYGRVVSQRESNWW
ncbi:MAG: hypothetical protein WEA82_06625 [Idiomarina sp.]